nr:probable beta-D-xylosidase 5 isoform X2 [Geotrypetes seraphini]XP_033812481.1 probable beta-D-xylosidase 5 isoform X2 [Geotrypetes seraphini]XP_033812482.1 probable beta-D-xylosidase 5 isoform X2 [Geotrypetes seraphini]XP_033812483.1 probable beta-D-xylosidase 5 isoform X2 [Geotrypetes seraphini]
MHFWKLMVVLLFLNAVVSSGQEYPFKDPSLPWNDRVNDLLNRLTLEEMVLQMARGGAGKNGPTPPIQRLGIKPYAWNTECLRGDVSAPGWATSFPQAVGLAASFSTDLIYHVANATATEVRAKHNYFTSIGIYSDHTGLSCFSPVVNIMRHPLWGRNQETYGEDPFLSGSLATAFVKGLQGDHPRYIKANAGCKHFDVHGGPENIPVSRFSFDAKVEERDWRMTFLPQFQACVQAGTYSIMCSYNRVNGIPACANKKLLTDILRKEWGFTGYVVSDEGAIEFIMEMHQYTKSFLETAIASVSAGCNLELAISITDNVFMKIQEAVAKGNLSVQLVKERVKPLFYTRMRLGEFDPPDMNPYNAYDQSLVQSEEHQKLSLKAAIKSFVLLKNLENILPFSLGNVTGKRIAVVGPFADNAEVLFGDYSPIPDPKYVSTPRKGLETLPADIHFVAGCSNPSCDHYSPAEVKAVAQSADIIVACLGTGIGIEAEGVDRRDLSLPGHQEDLLKDVANAAAGHPVVLLLFNAGPLDISWAKANESVNAILECFFPAQATGMAIVKTLVDVDKVNPAGRLPATWPAGMEQVPAMVNYTMEGRTYRYYGNQVPLYPFGYGLSYTSFTYINFIIVETSVPICGNLSVSVEVENTGQRDGDEVVQLYLHWAQASVPVPRWQLVGTCRRHIPAGHSVKAHFQVTKEQRAVWTDQWLLEPGSFTLYVGGQQPFQETRSSSNVLQADFRVSGAAQPLNRC